MTDWDIVSLVILISMMFDWEGGICGRWRRATRMIMLSTKELGTMSKNSLRGITLRGMAINPLHPSYSIVHSLKSHVKALSLYNFIRGFEWASIRVAYK